MAAERRPDSDNGHAIARTHAYRLKIPDIGRLAVACVDSAGLEFITAENLELLAKFHETSLNDLMQRIQGSQCTVLEDKYNDEAGYTRATEIAEGSVLKIETDPTLYRGIISILCDPRSFMMLAPAKSAADMFEVIQSKYETEMARVRNRLPIAVGMVFAEAQG